MLPPLNPFPFPTEPYERRHGPKGYTSYQNFKEWLRDEYTFRCSYCLARESWFPDPEYAFSVDHFTPKSTAPHLECVYENLYYCCRSCNTVKGVKVGLINPDRAPYGAHIRISKSARLEGLTVQGKVLIDLLALNSPRRIEHRLKIVRLASIAIQLGTATNAEKANEVRELLKQWFGFPATLPSLSTLAPPGGNSRPEGLESTYSARRARGELPDFY